MVSMKALMSLSQYDMGVLDGIAKVKDMLQENNSCNGKIARLIEQYHNNTQAEMVGIKTEPVEEFKHPRIEFITIFKKVISLLREQSFLLEIVNVYLTVPTAYLTVNRIIKDRQKFDISLQIHILLFFIGKIEVYVIKGVSLGVHFLA